MLFNPINGGSSDMIYNPLPFESAENVLAERGISEIDVIEPFKPLNTGSENHVSPAFVVILTVPSSPETAPLSFPLKKIERSVFVVPLFLKTMLRRYRLIYISFPVNPLYKN